MPTERSTGVSLIPLLGMPEFAPGRSISAEMLRALEPGGVQDGDVFAVTSKIISKAEGCFVPADEREALIERDTVRVVARIPDGRGSAIVQNRLGVVAAAAGVDASNIEGDWVLALPEDPDASARRLAQEIKDATGCDVGIVVTDTVGRAWRLGQTDIAIGSANIRLFDDARGGVDTAGKPLSVTQRCIVDEISAAADLVKGKTDGVPVALIRGMGSYVVPGILQRARDINRASETDLFSLGTAEAYAQGYADGSTADGVDAGA